MRWLVRIDVERQVENAEIDIHGNVLEEFAPLLTIWGQIRERTGGEDYLAGRIVAPRLAVITCRCNAATAEMTEADRIIARGSTWNIRSIARVGSMGRTLEILCETGVPT